MICPNRSHSFKRCVSSNHVNLYVKLSRMENYISANFINHNILTDKLQYFNRNFIAILRNFISILTILCQQYKTKIFLFKIHMQYCWYKWHICKCMCKVLYDVNSVIWFMDHVFVYLLAATPFYRNKLFNRI